LIKQLFSYSIFALKMIE